ncbi:Eyes absent-like protein 4 [Hordeum vulgare]|nr:Eyes absent-like protein 4 [Hordeum vulgare]
MKDDFKVAASITSMAMSIAAAEGRGKACAPRKAGAPPKKKKKELTPEERIVESAKRKGQRHAQDARDEAVTAAAAQQEDTNAWVKAATMETLLYLGLIPGFHVYPQGSRFCGECSPKVSIMAPSTPAPGTIDLNAMLVASGSSSEGMTKRHREMPADMLTDARHLFDRMLAAADDDRANRFHKNMIFEGAPRLVVLDGFPLDHEFPKDYGPKEEDDYIDIDGEPLFEEELTNQTAVGAKPKQRASGRRHTRRPRTSSFASVGGTLGKTRRSEPNKSGQPYGLVFIVSFMSDHGDGKKAPPRGKTNSKKEDGRDATLIVLLEKVEGKISKKDLRKQKRRQEKEEQMHAFMEIQRRRLEMDVERQAKMLELEEAEQAKMLDIEATNARTKTKEAALASMKTGAEIMKIDLNTVSPRKRLWFEKMQTEMFKFDQL